MLIKAGYVYTLYCLYTSQLLSYNSYYRLTKRDYIYIKVLQTFAPGVLDYIP